MSVFNKIIILSKKLASSLLKDEKPTDLEASDIFNDADKAYILKNLTDETLIKERLNLANQVKKKEDWEKVKSNITKPSVRFLYWKYTAAAAVIGLLATTYFFRGTLFNNSNECMPIIVNNNIKTGTDKATLTLEDGTIIALEKGNNYEAGNFKSNGEKIIYQANNRSNSKIAYNYLTIPRGGQFFIELSDGTKIWLNSETQLKYPVSFIKGETRNVELVYGEAYFDVSPSVNHKGSKFKVINQNQVVEVLGTAFNIKAYKDETNIYTTLAEGKVELDFNGKKQKLSPTQQSNFNLNTNALLVVNVDVYNEVSWRQGVFSFENKPLKEIMKVLSRWYNMNVVFINEEIGNEAFTGVLGKDQNIEDILATIKNFGIINNYYIKNKTITLK
ncbi:fec operon regulator FecR [Mariniflexile rhizosphaerae]|uniref:FecR family protein n=1 Tax=unclassified Mariniflexile TaxID=2643887 RepID=UPI000CBAED67|nr:FecR domain-containing protein [Mariniflexile sp. TRM1-10]AXP80760.1 fec operon regulator FecR [Mariniflexile sp. TRM1-10]PLB19832.1 MAG: Anti-sigma factor [Flavobacteriaceae bacterium FS1-H7996/R]